MMDLGQELIELIDLKKERLERLKAESRIVKVKNFKAIVSTIHDDPKLSMELYLRHLDDENIVMSIAPSVRGNGWEMLRLGDNKIVDFRAIAGNPSLHFVHVNGFVAKTESLIPIEEVIELAARSIVQD